MRLSFAIIAPLLFCTAYSFGQSDTGEDIKTLEGVVVTGTRYESDVRHLSQTVSIVSRKEIEQSLQPSLLPVITEQVPGLFATSRGIMGYGVSGGAAGSISIRGLGGGSGRMMVLIDGHPQYMGLMGHPIADSYQSLLAERVEVLRGPASVLYGSNAMGGIVNIVTRQARQDGVSTKLHAGYGSYNTLETELANSVKSGRFSSFVSASYNRTDGHRANLGFEQFGGYARVGYELSHTWNVYADANVTHFNASQPGTVKVPLSDADQHVTRGMASLSVANKYERTSGSLNLFYNWGAHWINDGYTESTEDNNKPKDYRFNSHDNMAGLSLYQSFGLFRGNRTTAGIDAFVFGGKANNKYVSGSRKGESDPLVDKTMNETAAYIDFRQDMTSWLTADAGLRADHHSEMGTEWIPKFGLSFHLPRNVEIKASASKGFRYPTIREMYMFPPQNPNLKPERMWNYEIDFAQTLADGRLRYGINVFYIDGENLIVAVPRQGASPLNMNTGKINNTGIEAEAAFRISSEWSADANYSFLHMDNPVIGSPEHKLYAGINFTKGRIDVSSGIQYIENLCTSTTPETTENFVLWNIRCRYELSKQFGIWARGENLLAQKYEINAGYPMPRATVMAGIDLNF